jgi:hypothetical protein
MPNPGIVTYRPVFLIIKPSRMNQSVSNFPATVPGDGITVEVIAFSRIFHEPRANTEYMKKISLAGNLISSFKIFSSI